MTPNQPNIAELVTRLRDTIDRGLVTAAFQPILNLKTGEVRAYEALTRMLPGSKFRHPGELFDAAEQAGMLWDLELVTRRATLRAAADWPAGVQLFLNCTPQVIADDRFAETLLGEVDEIEGLTPRRIVLEVTERSENQHVEGLHRQALVLQQHGFQLAIDDVGAGTSGLNRIMLLRPNWLKLDRELVADIDRDPVRTNLVRFLTHFARLSGVSIIGEGVERPAELERLIGLGVHCAQGFLIGRPGEHSQDIPDEVTEQVRAAASHMTSGAHAGESADRLARIVKPGLTAGPERSVTEIAERLDSEPGETGVVIIADGMLAGWCGRAEIEQALGAHLGSATIGSLSRPCHRTMGVGATIDEALEFVSSNRGKDPAEPIFLTETGRFAGFIDPGELFRAAAAACRAVEQRVAPLTGLPGRVLCEERVEHAIRSRQVLDAAFVDIRGLAEYNAVFGFELGDDLIRELVDVTRLVLEERFSASGEAFLGHLGDDRLLVLVPPGQTEAAADEIIELFQTRVSERGISPQAALSGLGVDAATSSIAIRVLGVRNLVAAHGSARELLASEPTLRAIADEQAAMNPVSPGYAVLVDADGGTGEDLNPIRLAA